MKNAKIISASNSTDPVLREMARLATLIFKDNSITKKERAELTRRLEAEHDVYIHRNRLDAHTNPPATIVAASYEGLIPTIQVMADFFGYSHHIIYPAGEDWVLDGRCNLKPLLTPALTDELASWQEEFEGTAWNDYRSDRTRSMQWVAFDYAGLQLAKRIKQHVEGRARVIYDKGIQNPFGQYDGHLEVL
jgi:hypothetical protein